MRRLSARAERRALDEPYRAGATLDRPEAGLFLPAGGADRTVASVSDLVEQIQSVFDDMRLLAPGESVLIAVSGGLDSMVLLHVLHSLAPARGWRLAIAHFNHGLRGRSSNADEALARRTAAELKLRFRAGRADVREFAASRGLSIEMAARSCRHAFLARTATALRMKKVALAHHSNDQAELFFLRLLRGAGPEGLRGMSFISPSPAAGEVELIRPFLGIARTEIEAFARERCIRFRRDASNDQLHCERNRVRHELLPSLRRQFQVQPERTVLRLMEIIGAESDFVAQKTREALVDGTAAFDELHLALQRRCLRSECLRLGIAPEFDLIEALRTSPGAPRTIDTERVVWRDDAGKLHLRESATPRFKSRQKLVDLSSGQGEAAFAGLKLAWKIEGWSGWPDGSKKPPANGERFDADLAGSTIRLRHWRPGDRFQPIGMTAPVKLQDLFVNSKVPRARRRDVVIAETLGGAILWVEGMRIGEPFKMGDDSRRCLVWRWSERINSEDCGLHEGRS